MANYNIPPYATLVAGIALIVVFRLPIWNQGAVIVTAVQSLGFILAVIGAAGVLLKVLKKLRSNRSETKPL